MELCITPQSKAQAPSQLLNCVCVCVCCAHVWSRACLCVYMFLFFFLPCYCTTSFGNKLLKTFSRKWRLLVRLRSLWILGSD
uniref:Uncharacterized protein n=1 Tax=Anguilla anguilla TaxID=7936 RepID=A0A0E9WD05_ANGAN